MTRHPRAGAFALALLPCALAQAQNPPPAETATIVVTGRPLPDPVSQALAAEQALTPGGVTLVDTQDLRLRNVTSLADMLRYVPGVWAASGANGDGSYLSMRGSNLDATNYDGNGIKLLQDGLPVTAADGNNHNRDVDPLSARDVIVARGANALTYGASTLGGAIDFISPTARDGAPNALALSGGSHGQRQGRVTWGTVAGAFDALVSLEGKRSDGFREHQRQDRRGLYANAGWQLGDGAQTRLFVTAIDNRQQLPGVLTKEEWQSDPKQAQAAALAGDYRYDVKTWRVANTSRWAIDADSSVSAGLSYEAQKLHHPIVYAPPFFSLLIETEQRNLGGMLRYQRRFGTHDLLAGVNLGRTTVKGGNHAYEPGGEQTLTTQVDNRAESLELFVMDRWRLAPRWTAVYGAQAAFGRREIRNVDAADGRLRDPEGDYRSLNPRIGLIHQLTPDTQLFANLSRLYEAPTLYQLEDDERGGQSTLDAMAGAVIEIGTRGRQAAGRHRWHWDLALYYARLDDEILSRDDPEAPGTSLAINAGDTVHAGLEALLGASLALDAAGTQRLEPLVSLTLNHFRFDGDTTYGNNRLPAAPRFALRGELIWRDASGVFAGPTVDVVGRREADFANTATIDGYTLWGLRAGIAGRDWELYAEGRNLADRRYVSLFSVQNVAAAGAATLTPGEPRSFYVGARVRF